MSITVNLYYYGKEARAFAREMEDSGTAEAVRRKEGNLRYEYFFPMMEEEAVLLIDSWENQEALDKHHHSAEMAKIMELRNKYDLHMKVERYVGAEAPAGDAKYIRK